jgi:molybdopterin molybdotransferase
MWFGVGGGKTVYALPGNPVSTLICLIRYVLPGLDAAMAATPLAPEQIALTADFEVKPALAVFLPVNVAWQASGGLCAQARPTRGSGDFTSLMGTDGFVELPPGPRVINQGTAVPLYRW